MQLGLHAALLMSDFQWQAWECLTSKPRAVQSRLLLRIVGQNQTTQFGQDHGFSTIKSIESYRKQIPIRDYEGVRSYIDRAKNGERGVLTAEPILMFSMTSGSTGEPKLIPVTASTQTSHARITRLWYSRAFRDHPGCAAGKVFGLVGAAVEGYTAGGLPYGAASGMIYNSSPPWVKSRHALPYEIAEIKDYQAKYYTAMRVALEQNVSFLGTPNPSTILRLVETVDRFRDEIIRDIHDGTVSSRFNHTNKIHPAVLAKLSPNPTRARELENLVKAHGRLLPSEYWPNLQLIGCWKGGSVGVRLKDLACWFGAGAPTRDLGYMASEAQMSLPITDDGSAGILAIDTNFYEFIPETEIDSTTPVTLTCDELEIGGRYYVLVTTAGGLYRYDINDLIRVVGFHGRTPSIEFLRKGRDVTNITGEKLHVNQVIEAMTQAQSATGLHIQHYCACADANASRYNIAVEFAGATPSLHSLALLLNEIDTRLQVLNLEFAQKRASQRLRPPVLQIMKPGWFERKASAALRRGVRDSQFKAQLLTSTPADPDEVMFVQDESVIDSSERVFV
jgi:hypothetical protein